jgi:hypothetical protein
VAAGAGREAGREKFSAQMMLDAGLQAATPVRWIHGREDASLGLGLESGKILKLRRNREEIIFSLWLLIET